MKDRFWQIIAAIAAVAAIVVAIGTFYLSQRANKKALTVEVISSSTLLNEKLTNTTKDLRLIYKNKDIPNVAISNVRISNTGRQPIRTSDIEVPLSIKLQCIEIISSKVISSDPPDLPISTNNEVSSVAISKALLNPNDDFIIEVVSVPNSSEGAVVSGVGGRIAGIGQIEFKATLQKEKTQRSFWGSLFGGIFGGLTAAVFYLVVGYVYGKLRNRRHAKA